MAQEGMQGGRSSNTKGLISYAKKSYYPALDALNSFLSGLTHRASVCLH